MKTRKPRNAVQIFQAPNGEWRWRVIRNWRIIAMSSEGYKRRAGAMRSIAAANTTMMLEPITNGGAL